MSERIEVRPMVPTDPPTLSAAFAASGWRKPAETFARCLREQAAGLRVLLVASVQGRPCGTLGIVWSPAHAYRDGASIPELTDLGVVPASRRQGIGSALLDAAEARVTERAEEVGLSVGVNAGYGAALRLFVGRGYLPDGGGLSYLGRPVPPGALVVADDDLVMRFVKRLRPVPGAS